MKLTISVTMFLFIAVGALFAAHRVIALEQDAMVRVVDVQAGELEDKIRKTCAAGAGALAIVEHKLTHGDAGAEEAAKDLLAYGLPWLDLCSTRRVDPMPTDLRAEIQALYADIDRWRDVEQP